MVKKLCQIGYINRIFRNLFKVNKEQLRPLYESLKSADCVVCGGSGRSLYSLNTAMSQLARMKDSKIVLTPDDTGFPGKDMYDATPELEKRYDNILLLINSGSGESEDPKGLAYSLAKYLKETKSRKIVMGLITSNPDSSIARIVQRFGHVVVLEGRGEISPKDEYGETGIMGDIFELGSLLLLQMMCEAIYEEGEVDRVFELLEAELINIGRIIDSYIDSTPYQAALEVLERRSDVFLGGVGTANEVVKMAAIRLFHIKKFLGENVYIARGVNTPRPRAGDLQILVSYTGETGIVINWCKIFRSLGGIVVSITGNKDSTLARLSNHKIILEEDVKPGQPRRFYMRTAFLLSPLPVKLAERLNKKGLILPEYVLNWYHSVTE
ncbi:SIS domain-containing protein [Candidatus Bathyarchaeota archaeon]|nr:SIS domain-containing protein [Candidatus Bathyarchaeota archaeon]